MTANVVRFEKPTGSAPKSKKRKPCVPKREGARDIAARIMKGKPPAKRFTFNPTIKREGDIVL